MVNHVVVGGTVTALDRAPDPVRRYFDALNHEDHDELATIWAPSAELLAVGARPRHGTDEISEYYRRLFDPWATHVDEPTRIVVAEGLVVAEIRFRGRTHTGRELEFDAVDVFDLDDDRVRRLSIWYDLAWVRRQL